MKKNDFLHHLSSLPDFNISIIAKNTRVFESREKEKELKREKYLKKKKKDSLKEQIEEVGNLVLN